MCSEPMQSVDVDKEAKEAVAEPKQRVLNSNQDKMVELLGVAARKMTLR